MNGALYDNLSIGAHIYLIQVLNIRKNPNNKTHKQLALQFGVAESTISGIIARLRWTHI